MAEPYVSEPNGVGPFDRAGISEEAKTGTVVVVSVLVHAANRRDGVVPTGELFEVEQGAVRPIELTRYFMWNERQAYRFNDNDVY